MPKPLFDLNQLHITVPKKEKPLHDCNSCGLHLHCKSPKTTVTGKGELGILVIGDPISKYEDDTGNNRHGTIYQALRTYLKRLGNIDLDTDCWYTHSVKCYAAGKNKKRKVAEKYGIKTASGCSAMLDAEIKKLKPKVIVTTSASAWDVLLFNRTRGRASTATYMDWCGSVIPDQELNTWVVPLFDTKIMKDIYEEQEKKKYPYHKLELRYSNSLRDIAKCIMKPVPQYKYKATISADLTESIALLKEVNTWDMYAFDLETTGIKSQSDKQRVFSISFSNGKKHIAVRWWDEATFISEVSRVLTNHAVKIAHNKAFERAWMFVKHGIDVTNLIHDTMIAQHCLFNDKPTNLKFCTYANLGILGYDGSVENYLKSSDSDSKLYGGNAVNTIHSAPLYEVLEYNAIDSGVTYDLLQIMLPALSACYDGYSFFCESEYYLTGAHINGLMLDTVKLGTAKALIEPRIDIALNNVMKDDILKSKWPFGLFNPKSDKDVRILIYNVLKEPVTTLTDKGAPSVDVDTLLALKYKYPFLETLIEYKRLSKLHGTYIAQFEREVWRDKIHVFFNLHRVKTFRSSANMPSFQNIPKRDKEAKRIIRSTIVASRGCSLVEADIKGAEVSAAASISGDRNLIKYVSDLSLDMHRDLAAKCFWYDSKDVPDAVRGSVIKGPLTFSQFYGSYFKNSASGILEAMDIIDPVKAFGVDLKQRCMDHGIRTFHESKDGEQLSDWEAHIEGIVNYLWNDMFPDYMRYRNDTWAFYKKHGYIDMVTGFRYNGIASKTELTNAPVQGPAYHIQQWCFNYIMKRIKEKKMDTKIIGSIHDAILADVPTYEESHYLNTVYEAFQEVRNHWKWLNVPVFIEAEKSAVDGNWAEMTKLGYLKGK